MSDGHRGGWKGNRRRAKGCARGIEAESALDRLHKLSVLFHCRVRGNRSQVMFRVLVVGTAHGGRPSKYEAGTGALVFRMRFEKSDRLVQTFRFDMFSRASGPGKSL